MSILRRLAIALVLLPWVGAQADSAPGQAAVATAHPAATAAGREVLEAGAPSPTIRP